MTEYDDLVEREALRVFADSARYGLPLDAGRLRENIAYMGRADWTPSYSRWRHGGSYVHNVLHPGGGVGCVASARHTRSGKFESACFELGEFKTRDAAAAAERRFAVLVTLSVLELMES